MNNRNYLLKIFLTLFCCVPFFCLITCQTQVEDRFLGAFFGCAIGDAMGKPTEFRSMKQIFARYPNGVRSFKDFHESDFSKNKSGKKIACYTDDTAMALLVAKEFVKACKNNYSLDCTMGNLSRSFVKDMKKVNGWAAPYRAPGNSCLAGVRELKKRIKSGLAGFRGVSWWNVEARNAGGCGSVMRVFSIGLLFSKDPREAERWAVSHSTLTHGASSAKASCAAMGVGVALAVRQEDPDVVVNKMIEAARRYDQKTADMISEAAQLARANKKHCSNIKDMMRLSQPVYKKFLGWAAHDAIAATVYTFLLSPDNIKHAIMLGVHTPGDSDSIACMAGALVGARVGVKQIPQNWIETVEGSQEIKEIAREAAKLVSALPN